MAFDPSTLLKPVDEDTKIESTGSFNPSSLLEVDAEPIPEEFAPPKPDIEFDKPEDRQLNQAISFDDMASDTDYMEMLREYQKKRFGKKGDQEEGESNADYLRRFLTHTREFEFNSLDMGAQLDWVRTASEEDRMKFGYLYSQLDRLPDFYEDGGTGAVSAMRDFGKSLIFDPLNYIGFGTGKVAGFVATRAITKALKEGGKKLALEEAAKLSAKRMIGTKAGKIAAGGVAVEAGAAAVQDLKQQEVDMLSQRYGEDTPTERDFGRAALVGGIGLGAGALGVKLSGGLGGSKILRNVQDTFDKKQKIADGLVARNKDLAAQEAAQRSDSATLVPGSDLANGIIDLTQGRKVLDDLAEGASEDQARAYNSEVMKRVGGVLTDIVRDMAETGDLGKIANADTKAFEVMTKVLSDNLATAAQKGGKAGDAIEQTRKMLDDIEGGENLLDFLPEGTTNEELINSLEQAISKQGLSIEQFRNAFGASASEAAKILQSGSQTGKVLKAFFEIDPEFQQQLKVFDDPDGIVGPMGKAIEFGRKLDRERRALMVTQISTTMRNVYSAVTRLGMDGLAGTLESVIYQMGRQVDASLNGTTSLSPPKFSLREAVRDGFGALGKMADANETAEISDALLQHNPRLLANMNRSLNELAPDKELSKATRFLNGLNIGQDLFFRRAIFVDTIDKQLRRSGLIVDNPTKVGQFKSMEEFVASGKVLPPKVLENAVEESLAFTFARIPKESGGKPGDSLAYAFLKFNERLGPIPAPIGTAAFPFAKFMVNALQFQFQYSPASVVTGVSKSVFTRKAIQKASETARKAGELADEAAEQAKKAGDMNLSRKLRTEAKALAKEADKKATQAQQVANQARKELSSGMVGTAALYAAINHRASNQDTNWYEYKTDDGRTGDLRPYFPITPYLAIADLIVKAGVTEDVTLGTIEQPDISADVNLVETFEGVTGAQFRTGASSFVIDQFEDLVAGETDFLKSEKFAEVMGQYTATLFGGAVTPLRVVRDVQAAYDTEAAIVRDAKQTSGIGFGDRFSSGFAATIQKELPGLSKDLPEFQAATREDPLYRQSSLTSQLFGTPRKVAERSDGEKELVRLGIKDYAIVPGTGAKEADALVKKYMGIEFEKEVNKLVNTPEYKRLSLNQKKAKITNTIKQFRSRAKRLAVVEAENDASKFNKPFTAFDKAQYTKLSKLKRRLADDYYRQHPDYGGRSVMEMQELEPEVNHLRLAIRIANAEAKQ